MSVKPDEERKLWLPRAPSSSSTRKPSFADACHYEPRPVSLFSRIFQPKKVAPTPPPAFAPTLISAKGAKLETNPSNSFNKERRKSSGALQPPLNLTFRQAFGALGVPLVVVVTICIVWTCWLVFLTLAPNEAANLLMNTGDYDNGNFWLIVERAPAVKWTSVAGLLLVTACYVLVLVRIVRFRNTAAAICRPPRDLPIMQAWKTLSACWMERCTPGVKNRLERVYRFYTSLTGFNGVNRKFFNTFQKACDLGVQGLVLRRSFNQGLPDPLLYGYASFMCLNGLSVAVSILTAKKHTAFAEVLIDSLFDLAAAVLYPIAVLGFCFYNFSFDRDVYLVNAEILPDGNFERYARMQADPAQVALFLINFNSLRISGTLDFALSIGLNLSFCFRFVRVITSIISQRCHVRSSRRSSSQNVVASSTSAQLQRSVPSWVAVVFGAASVGVVVFTHSAVTASNEACEAYPECVVFAHVWNTGQCPCIMMIDGTREPRTALEWNHPEDVTDKVRALAAAGRLHGLQLINRQLLQWPEELRRCTGMITISLIYTGLEELPAWAKELKQLQHLHFEGKYGLRNLVTLPADLFSDLPELTFIHLANHHNLVALPPFTGTPNLRSLVLGVLLSLTELPPFDHLPTLETLALAHMQLVPAVPDMAPLVSLSRLAVFRPNHMCCNGFIGACDLAHSFCQADTLFNVPAASCLDPSDPRVATAATKAVFAKFAASVCQKAAVPFLLEGLSDFPTPERIAACDGVPYRRCEVPGVTVNGIVGMCSSCRMQVVACNVDHLFIDVRKRQIQLGVGPPCDPEVESWLGCTTGAS